MLTIRPVVALRRLHPDDARLPELHTLIRQSFAYMDGVIDPPSSAHLLTIEALRAKCATEHAIVALDDQTISGCVFLAEKADHFYLGKLAIHPEKQGQGIGRHLMMEAEAIARSSEKPVIELQVRIELTANHAVFTRLGFVESGRTAHQGYTRPTSITMRKVLATIEN